MTIRTAGLAGACFLVNLGAIMVLAGCDDDSAGTIDAAGDAGGDVRNGGADSGDAVVATASADAADAGHADSNGPPADAAPLTQVQSFTAATTITLTPRGSVPGQAVAPITFEMLLRLDPVAGRLTIAQPGSALTVEVRPRTGGGFETDSFSLPIAARTAACAVTLTVDRLVLGVSAERLTGQGGGTAAVIFGDVVFPYDGALSLAGLRDTTGPSLGSDLPADPLGDLFLPTSEPVPTETTARLVAGAARVNLVSEGAGMVLGFRKSSALALRHDTTYQVEVDGWRDLAQNPGHPLPTVTTGPAPELAAEDGFESAGATLGGAMVVQAPDLAVIAGTKSVLIRSIYSGPLPVTNRFRVRLTRQPGDTVVHVTLRPISNASETVGTHGVSVRIAAPGGAIVEAPLPMTETVSTRIGGSFFGTPRTLAIPLPAGTDPDIVFDMATLSPPGCGLASATAGYLIDDLRID